MSEKEMDRKIEVWNIFHDGSIVEVKGTLPNLSLRIEIPCLRDMFRGNGYTFWAHMQDCTHIEYLNWEEDQKEKFKFERKNKDLSPGVLSMSVVGIDNEGVMVVSHADTTCFNSVIRVKTLIY